MIAQTNPLIGTAVWIRKEGNVLLGKRAGARTSGAGTWCPPGGHLEMFETIEECAIRETKEEASIEIENIHFLSWMEDHWHEQWTHYITFHFIADWKSGEPQPKVDEQEEWNWFEWSALPRPLFRPAQLFVAAGFNPLEITR
ncbi:NUDIX domain-containing protein [Candidatus Kaiserbacteria bacterium]|nr:NUDIX domain-containing protein [Candidatus Kaiserbacteria bacterium]